MPVGDFPLIFNNGMFLMTSASEDLSPYLTQMRVTREFDDHDVTRFGMTDHAYVPGLGKWAVAAQALQDFRSTSVIPIDKRLFQILGDPNGVAIELRPVNAARSSDNPGYIGRVTLFSHSPMDGSIGEPLKTTLNFRGAGSLTRSVTSS